MFCGSREHFSIKGSPILLVFDDIPSNSRSGIYTCSPPKLRSAPESSRALVGPLELPSGTIPATNKTMQTPCCDVFKIENGKIKSFHCYTAATILLGQLGIF